MKNLKNIFLLFALTAAAAFGQATLSSTTLGAAITTTSQTTITLTSTSTMATAGPNNQINTVLYVDREYMRVLTVVDSTHVTVLRAQGVGAAARPATHASGAKVYFANTTTYAGAGNITINAEEYFRQGSVPLESEVSGSCTATNELVLPVIYLFDGNVYDCKNGSSGGQWIFVASGTAGQQGSEIRALCTGTVGSAETEYLNTAACSGATTSTARYIITTAGTLANLTVYSSANVTGGTSKDVLTVYKNGSPTTITCTIAASAATCTDTAHSVAVAAGDVLTFQFVTATSDTAANLAAGVGLF